ncbi:MAG: urease accessory protein UreD [Campylobacteraceae bacterium]|jgi:urease accessory protein|nr:urease accessory protein UreD [Campylobacteraceae bacterium]
MSLEFELKENVLTLKKMTLPSRCYLFRNGENYVKLLNVGEGLFPNDKICTRVNMTNSNLILASESALKVYPSECKAALNRYVFCLKNSNLEFLNDEVIMFKSSRFIQFLTLSFDEDSTFFYSELLSSGRSFEEYDFEKYAVRNRFIHNKKIEYLEEFAISGSELKEYLKRHGSKNRLFAKVYIKSKDNEAFGETLFKAGIKSFEKTQNGVILICIILGNKISSIKSKISLIWQLYRKMLKKDEFDLGKR